MSGKNHLRMFMLLLVAMLAFVGMMHIQVIIGQGPSRVPGVKAGDYFRYGNLTAVWSDGEPPHQSLKDLNNTQWIAVEVKAVSGTNITFEFKMHFINDTDFVLMDWIDVNTGPNPAGVGYSFPFFISANLQVGDAIYNTTSGPYTNWRINETISRSYLGTMMDVNHIKRMVVNTDIYDTYATDHYWNKESGVLTEFDAFIEYGSGGTFTFHFNIISSSSCNRYVYEIEILSITYVVEVETDGIIGGFSYTNFTFSLDWSSKGSYTNITLPRTLNNTGIKVMYDYMMQGWDSTPNIIANETHYFIFGVDSEGCIVWVCFGEPQIEMDLSAPTLALSYYVNITGQVTYRSHPMDTMGVWVGWSSGGLPNEISTVLTSEDGSFLVSWMPHATGTFYITARIIWPRWLPDEVPYPEAHACLAVSLPFEEHVFSVVSNSTISALSFNSTANVLSFSASGPDGTTGYAKVFISKQLLTDISSLIVYVDGNQTDYTYSCTDNSWTITIMYQHSTHEVQMVIPEFPSTIATFLTVLITSTAAVLLNAKKRTKHTSSF